MLVTTHLLNNLTDKLLRYIGSENRNFREALNIINVFDFQSFTVVEKATVTKKNP